MDKNEYQSKMSKLTQDYYDAKEKLNFECAMLNKTAIVGDIVTDGRGNILVEKIGWNNYNEIPSATYYGPVLTAKMKPNALGKTGVAIEGKHFKIIKKAEQ